MTQPDSTHPTGHASWRETVRDWGSITCVSTADFDAPIWTNKQHLMARLASERPVLYLDSLGLRRPRLTVRDLARMASRLGRRRSVDSTYALASTARPDLLSVVAPLVIPLHEPAVLRRINRLVLSRQLSKRLGALPQPRLLWTYNPVAIDEIPLSYFDGIVYHCVDDLASMPRVSARAIHSTEPRLVAGSTAVFASSDALASRLSSVDGAGTKVHHTHNVADAEHFGQARLPGPIPDDLASIPSPRAIFIGSLNDYKIDWELLLALADARPDWSIVLIGPMGGEAATQIPELSSHPNLFALGHREYGVLPDYLRGADAGLIPYRLTAHTEAVFPLKTWEYLAAGVRVVSTPLPALAAVNPPVEFARTASGFAEALDGPSRFSREQRVGAASRATWDDLLNKMFQQIPRPLSAGGNGAR